MYEIMFILLGFSFLVVSSPLLRANDVVAKWLDQVESSIFGSIFHLAYYSPKEALTVLVKYFGVIGGGATFFQCIIMQRFGLVSNTLLISSALMVYASFSLHTWMVSRKEVVGKLKDDCIKGVKATTKWSMAIFFVILVGYTAIQFEANPQYEPEFHVLGYVFAITIMAVSFLFGVASMVFYLIMFLPAFLVIIYIWLVVYIAKFLAKSNRSSIKYACNIYFVVVSLYTFYLTYKGLV
ncbi:hypothetical protein [Vibrio metschnikovii]|uniref:hypothetical protein n=1 Tax=Vibrio metschnikovii TaxID=28172 RepID=UPI002FCACABE